MLKLFAVRLSSGELLTNDNSGDILYFRDKMKAKKERNKHDNAVVVLGPDHHRSNSNRGN